MKTSIFQNTNENIVRISALKFFVASWGFPGSFFGLPRDLVSNIINKEAYRKPQKASRKPQGSYKKFQGRNPYNIFVAILKNRCLHKFILLTDLHTYLQIIWKALLWNSLPYCAFKLSFQLVVPVYKTKYPIKKGNSSPWKQKNLTIAQRCDLLIVCPVYSL